MRFAVAVRLMGRLTRRMRGSLMRRGSISVFRWRPGSILMLYGSGALRRRLAYMLRLTLPGGRLSALVRHL